MKSIVVFLGGGALGAFGAGAWQVLARDPGLRDGALVAVAGVGTGALDAAWVAQQHGADDAGARVPVSLWRERLAAPSRRWLDETFAPYGSAPGRGPLLAVASLDVLAGTLRLFDSDCSPLNASHLAAAGALPGLEGLVQVGGRPYRASDAARASLLPMLLQRLLQCGRVQAGEPLRVVSVEPQPLALPGLDDLPGIRIARGQRVRREPLAHDGWSSLSGVSRDGTERLLEEGRQAALRTLHQALWPAARLQDEVEATAAWRREPAAPQPALRQ